MGFIAGHHNFQRITL